MSEKSLSEALRYQQQAARELDRLVTADRDALRQQLGALAVANTLLEQALREAKTFIIAAAVDDAERRQVLQAIVYALELSKRNGHE